MKSIMLTLILVYTAAQQETPPDQPHTEDPAQCTQYCYPEGGPSSRPKGTPEGIPGYECQGTHCGHVNHDDEEIQCDEGGGCTTFCAKPCCTCLKTCI